MDTAPNYLVPSLPFIVAAVIGLALFVWWLIVLIGVVRTPAELWAAAGQSQLVALLLVILLGLLGALVFRIAMKPQLEAATAATPDAPRNRG